MMETMLEECGETLPVNVNYLPDIYLKKAEIELKETTEMRMKGLRFLRDLAKADKNLCEIEFEDDFLQQFLRHSKYNLERAFSQLRNLVLYRQKYPAVFQGVHQDILNLPSTKFCTLLPRRCQDGCTIVLFELGKWNPDEMQYDDFQRIIAMVYYQILRHPLSQINGFKVIHDFAGESRNHMKHITPRKLYHLHLGMNSYPTRFKEIHMVTKSVAMTMAWSIGKHFLSEKIRSRVIFHSDPKGLLNHFPRSVLPVHYGGDLKNHYMGEWLREANQLQGISSLGGHRNVI